MLNKKELQKKHQEYSKILDDYEDKLRAVRENYEELASYLDSMYKFIKEIAPTYYNEKQNSMSPLYTTELIKSVRYLEEMTPCWHYIIPIPEDYSLAKDNVNIQNEISDEIILDWLVCETRKACKREIVDTWSFESQCTPVSRIVERICHQNGIQCQLININPGFLQNPSLQNGSGFHTICIVRLKSGYYVVDCTYRQFFLLKGNSLERIGVPYLQNGKPGIFMTMTKERLTLATALLERGWIKLDSCNTKNYFDGFAISFRNGHFYKQTGNNIFTTDYDSKMYAKFLTGSDNQVNHEGELVLRRQVTPSSPLL